MAIAQSANYKTELHSITQRGKKYNPSFIRRASVDESFPFSNSEDDRVDATPDRVHSTKEADAESEEEAGLYSEYLAVEKTSSKLIRKLMAMSRNGTAFVSDFAVEQLVATHMKERHAHMPYTGAVGPMASQMASMVKSIDDLKRVVLGRPGGASPGLELARSLLQQGGGIHRTPPALALSGLPPLPLRGPNAANSPFAGQHLDADDVTSDDSEAELLLLAEAEHLLSK